MLTNFQLLEKLIQENYIHVQEHPSGDLRIYNYSPKAQYDRIWNEWTITCRGLILDRNYQIVARPFPKFFNVEEHQQEDIPLGNFEGGFEVYEKLDGSLGILYPFDNQFFIATRGSFSSKQSQKATQILYQKYAHTLTHIQQGKTYLFGIIYPENKIAIDYGAKEDLILLAVIDNQTGKDEVLPQIGFPLVKRYDGITDIHRLKNLQEDNKEGFVIKFASGFRVKVKFEEYVRLHRILTQVSSTNIWEFLANKQSLDQVLECVPDEFYNWVKKNRVVVQNV
jgi:RNA ligase